MPTTINRVESDMFTMSEHVNVNNILTSVVTLNYNTSLVLVWISCFVFRKACSTCGQVEFHPEGEKKDAPSWQYIVCDMPERGWQGARKVIETYGLNEDLWK